MKKLLQKLWISINTSELRGFSNKRWYYRHRNGRMYLSYTDNLFVCDDSLWSERISTEITTKDQFVDAVYWHIKNN